MDRAMQFLPFNSLEGYYDIINEASYVKEERKELTEDEIDNLNNKMMLIKEKMIVKITYYKDDGYQKIVGMVSFIDKALKSIKIIKTKIYVSDILNIEIIIDN